MLSAISYINTGNSNSIATATATAIGVGGAGCPRDTYNAAFPGSTPGLPTIDSIGQ